MAPPPSTMVPPLAVLVVRILTIICLVISIIIIATNTATTSDDGISEIKIKFKDFYAYRYMLFTAVLGIAYTLVQSAFTIFHVSTGNRIGGDALAQFDFYGDKLISYMLATGAAAGFGLSVDLKRILGNGSNMEDFADKSNAAASLLLIGFLLSAISSVISSVSLPKRA